MFICNLHHILGHIKKERPQCVTFTVDLDCTSSQQWAEDIESPKGAALDEFVETNGLYQLIDELTNIRKDNMSCIDLIITDQTNMFVDYGVHPSF